MSIRPFILGLGLFALLAGCGGEATGVGSADPSLATSVVPFAVVSPAPSPKATPAEVTTTPEPAPTAKPTPTPTLTPPAKPTPKPTPVPTPKPINYAKLSARAWAKVVKNPDAYLGKTYQLWGCLSQFDAATGTDSFRAQTSYKKLSYWYTDGSNVFFSGDEDRLADFVQDDVVVMNVTSLGAYSYDTQNGGNTTVPLFEVEKITHKGSCG